jgi:hypothetical protein
VIYYNCPKGEDRKRGKIKMNTKELKKGLNEMVNSAIETVEDTTDMCGELKTEEYFPITTYHTITINGKEYNYKMEITLK